MQCFQSVLNARSGSIANVFRSSLPKPTLTWEAAANFITSGSTVDGQVNSDREMAYRMVRLKKSV
jgi:hypothetical protein